jgi:ATP-dependent Zn protease
MEECHQRVRTILTAKREQLELISQTLLEKETILGEELQQLLDSKATAGGQDLDSE